MSLSLLCFCLFESMCNLLPLFYCFQGLLLECKCLVVVFDLVITCPFSGFICNCNGSLILKLNSMFLVFHIMGVMGIFLSQYWLQIDAEANFNCHLELIRSHYRTKRHLEPVKLSSMSFKVAKICPSILSTNGLEIQANIFKITLKSNVVTTMEAPFHVNPLTQLWRTLEAFHIPRHSFPKFSSWQR